MNNDALAPLKAVPQWILYKKVPRKGHPGKLDKIPHSCLTQKTCDAHDPANWTIYDIAASMSIALGDDYGVGFVLTKNDPFGCIDIDNCLMPDNTWSPFAIDLIKRLPGAAVEVSISGTGLHVLFACDKKALPVHGCKNVKHGVELYTERRFIAIGHPGAVGNASTNCTEALISVIKEFFPAKNSSLTEPTEWTDGGTDPANDDALISKMLASNSAAAAFGNKASFADLWNADPIALGKVWPDTSGERPYDASSADMALACHLAWWCSNDCERIKRLMMRSSLCRDKYDRPDYLRRTILNACSRQKNTLQTIELANNFYHNGVVQEISNDQWEPAIREWPSLDSPAFHGLADEFVKLASANSEADPAAILITFLVRFGVEVGNGPTLYVGDTRHKARLAAVIVGASSKARKGTSGKPVERLFKSIVGSARQSPGPFSSGEGIIHAVRDPVKKWDDKKQIEIVSDPGEKDKRLFVLDEEFAGVMAQTKREGNTLSMVIRNAWDNGNLDPLTKTNKTTATNAHIGWVSHITTDELHAKLADSEAFNGFANRILWVCARRSKNVPLPEPMNEFKLADIGRRLFEKITLFRNQPFIKIEMGCEVRKAWRDQYYDALTKDNPGLVGCVINRAEAQVVRLAMIYCLLDGMTTIGIEHLEASLALWQYCEQSARYIFHGRQTDGIAEKILSALQQGPMTGTELYRLFENNISKKRLEDCLSQLKASHQIEDEKVQASGKGRNPIRWKIKTAYERNELNEKISNWNIN